MNWLNELLIVVLSLAIFVSSLYLWRHSKIKKYKNSNFRLMIFSGISLIINILVEIFLIKPLNIKFGLYAIPIYLGTLIFCSLTLPCFISQMIFTNASKQFRGQTTKFKETLYSIFEPVQFTIYLITNVLGFILVGLFVSIIVSHPHVNVTSFFYLFSLMVKRYGNFFAMTTLFFELGWNICVICMIISSILGVTQVSKIYLLNRAINNLKIKEQNEFVERLAKFNTDVRQIVKLTDTPVSETVLTLWENSRRRYLAEKAIVFENDDDSKKKKPSSKTNKNSHAIKKKLFKRKKKK